MEQITCVINGQRYRLSCNDGDQHQIFQLVEYVNQKLLDTRQELGSVGNDRLLVMVALTIADELMDLKSDMRVLQNKVDQVKAPQAIFEIQSAVERVEKLKEKFIELDFEDIPDEGLKIKAL